MFLSNNKLLCVYVAGNSIVLCVILYTTVGDRYSSNPNIQHNVNRIAEETHYLTNFVKLFTLHEHGTDKTEDNTMSLHKPSKQRKGTANSSTLLVVLKPTWLPAPITGEQQVTNCDIPCFITGDNAVEAIKRSSAVIFRISSIQNIPFNKQRTSDPNMVLKSIGVDPTSVIKVGMSMESTRNHPQQFSQISKYDIEFSFRQSSDVHRPYYRLSHFDLLKPVLKWTSRQSAIVFIARICQSTSRRQKLVKLLQKYVQVDSVSGCLHNKKWPYRDVPKSDKRGLLERYKVYLAAENSIETDYVTEKVYDGLEAGAVPIYLGAPNVKEFIPANSTIIVPANFSESDIIKISQTVKKIFDDEAEYDRWTSFKHHDHEKWFKKKFSFTDTDQLCWVCRRVIAQKEGYEWDRKSHQIF